MRDSIVFYINGRRYEVRGPGVFQPLSDFLRYELALVGTKVVCAEGDCGACAVLLGRLTDGQIDYRPVDSCIQYLYQLDAAHIITIEGLKYDGQLNPVQKCFVDGHGAQCGFCTPGFIVSSCAMFERGGQVDDHRIRRDLTGNLCRCTGYDPIIAALLKVDANEMRKIDSLYPPAPIANDLKGIQDDSIRIEHDDRIFYQAKSVEDAVAFRTANPTCMIIAGGTDLGVLQNKGKISPKILLRLPLMRSIVQEAGALLIDAGVTFRELEEHTRTSFPEYFRMLERHGSPLIRGGATLAGNIANGSPIGDAMPALFVLNGEIELAGPAGRRWVNMNAFYTGYRQSVMKPDEFITRVKLPLPKSNEVLKLYKISRRWDMDISTFTAAIWMRLDGQTIAENRIALGGVAAVILRLPKTEAALSQQLFNEATLQAAGEIAASEITPISDVRGSADYRRSVARNIFLRFYHEVAGTSSTDHHTLYDPQPIGDLK